MEMDQTKHWGKWAKIHYISREMGHPPLDALQLLQLPNAGSKPPLLLHQRAVQLQHFLHGAALLHCDQGFAGRSREEGQLTGGGFAAVGKTGCRAARTPPLRGRGLNDLAGGVLRRQELRVKGAQQPLWSEGWGC